MKYANLHLHSTYSDCQFTPEQLLLIGKSLGYKAMALTDHETDAGVMEFAAMAEKMGIETLVGAEFYGVEDGVNLHLVALDYDPNDTGIRTLIQNRCRQQMVYTRKCVERGIELGFIQGLTWDDVLAIAPDGAWLCIDSVMRAMQIKKLVPAMYDWDQFRKNVFKAPEMKIYKTPSPSACEVIQAVRKAGGIVALAHPKKQTHFVKRLVEYGLNGIEVCHPNLDEEQENFASMAAEEFNLYRCGGTDHTGPMSGCSGKGAVAVYHGVTEEEFFTIKERRLG